MTSNLWRFTVKRDKFIFWLWGRFQLRCSFIHFLGCSTHTAAAPLCVTAVAEESNWTSQCANAPSSHSFGSLQSTPHPKKPPKKLQPDFGDLRMAAAACQCNCRCKMLHAATTSDPRGPLSKAGDAFKVSKHFQRLHKFNCCSLRKPNFHLPAPTHWQPQNTEAQWRHSAS